MKHVVITGGSKGIGRELAFCCVRKGCNISIIARNEDDLKKTHHDLQAAADRRGQQQKVHWYSLDLSKNYSEIEAVFDRIEHELGPIHILINNAGTIVQGAFDDIPVSVFEDQMALNFYTANLFRGLADAVQMELLPYNISVSVLCPPNTETDVFKSFHGTTMPVIMRKMTAIAGIVTPEDVAISHISDIENGHYLTTNGLMGWFLGVGTAGASPERSLLQAFAQIFLAGLVRGILLLIIGYFNSLSRNQMAGKKQQESE
ncbi:oxidoreductase, short chain dehydrogenase/reductase family protein [Ancylostoma ceylanicum]|uniref:Oxidoreductase, short chain dehydrogenase/reductase family protein n=1 Tax=Ancylostoma ceylanicum TaxID=53326 RepID=A0A0D6LU22_9BILA|nr:oxidoreductase, short chain dehydrogenase/reductase family protein [Ancylostoma ceylanicum]